jgi:hypothetical protein
MKALINNVLCFGKTETNRFDTNSGGIFLTQWNLKLWLKNQEIKTIIPLF